MSILQVQHQLLRRFSEVTKYIPHEYIDEPWIFAAAYVVVYSLLAIMRSSTLGSLFFIIYVALVVMLALKFHNMGPLHNAKLSYVPSLVRRFSQTFTEDQSWTNIYWFEIAQIIILFAYTSLKNKNIQASFPRL